MTQVRPLTTFAVYRWTNPETTCDYPVLALAEDRSALLTMGDYSLSFEWGIPDEAVGWLAHDFERTGELLVCDLSMVRYLLHNLFPGGTEFGVMTFDNSLEPSSLQLSISDQAEADQGPEYLIEGYGRYRRRYRQPSYLGPVSQTEEALLSVCVSAFGELAVQAVAHLTEPPPPRYRS